MYSSIKVALVTLLICLISIKAYSTEPDKCLKEAFSQAEMNKCAGLSLKATQSELDRVYERIVELYSHDDNFLTKLQKSQDVWQESIKAELELMYPESDKQKAYGTVYPLCASGFKLRLILARIEYLKKWLKGHSGDDACSGSIMHEYCINNKC